MPSCGINCVIFRILPEAAGAALYDGLPNQPPVFVRQTHQTCISCNNSVSDYEHTRCYQCALPNTFEFYYHHQRCIPQQPQQQN
jgi:hypothetical protein